MTNKNEFLRLFLKYNSQLYGFIFLLVPNHSDAEDILQETTATLWNKFETYENGTNFLAWSKQVARYKIMNFYNKKKIEVQLDDDFIDRLMTLNEKIMDRYEEQKVALQNCLKKLDIKHANFLLKHYSQGVTIKKIAEDSDMSVNTLYKKMARLLTKLRSCINETLLAWDQI